MTWRITGQEYSMRQQTSVVVIQVIAITIASVLVAFNPALGLAGVGVILIVGLILFRVEYGVILLLFVLSLGLESLDLSSVLENVPGATNLLSIVSSGHITVYDFLIVVVLAAAMIKRFASHKPAKDKTKISKLILLYLGFGLFISVIASVTVEFANLSWSLVYLLRLCFTMLTFVVMLTIRPSETEIRRYLQIYVLLALIPAARGVYQAFFETPATSLEGAVGFVRFGGFSPMGLGTYLGSVIGICLTIIGSRTLQQKVISRWLALVMLLVSIGTIVISQKRAPVVAALTALIIWIVMERSQIKRYGWLITAAVVFLIGIAVWRGGIFDRTFLSDPGLPDWLRNTDQIASLPAPLSNLLTYDLDPNITTRFGQWYLALEAAVTYPQGVGFRTMVLSPYSYPHNQYLQILAEFGLVGLICFGALAWQILKLGYRLYRGNHYVGRLLGGGVLYGFMVMLVQGVFEEAFHNWDGMALLWLLVGLAVVQLSNLDAETNPEPAQWSAQP